MAMMKALVKRHSRPGLWLEEVEIPTAGPNDVLIKIKRTAICGTDLHIYNWDEWSQATIPVPMVVGHEFVGEVVELGNQVTDLKIGELVSGEGHIVCGRCRNCLAGRRHLCINTNGVGVNRQGCFAEYLSIPATNVWKADPKIPLNVTACFDPFGNAIHTALQFDLIGEDVLITGAGPIGCMAVGIAKHCGARHVVITDVNDYRLELAAKMGATRCVRADKENLTDVQKELGLTEGFDVGLEMSGNAHAFNDMVANMINGGKIALLGIHGPDTKVDWNKVVFGMLTLKGIYGREMYETWYKMQTLVQGGLDISPIVTHEYGFEDFEKGFDIMNSGKSGKVILNWE